MQIWQPEKGGLVKAWIDGVLVEDQALAQVTNLAAMPFVHKHIALMPDAHWGYGTTVGSVFATKGAIIPAAVGVDIGCGMAAQRTTLTANDLPDNLLGLRTGIETRVPHGRTDNGGDNDRGAWHTPSVAISQIIAPGTPLGDGLWAIMLKHPKIAQAANRAPQHLGTLGAGNHFIEVCLDEEDRVWIMLHSGSRGIGNRIGSYFIERAKIEMRRYFINLPDAELAYLVEGSDGFNDYCSAVAWAQRFARANRDLMMTAALAALSAEIPKPFTCDQEAVNCHHNYVTHEYHFGADVQVTRKGAVRIAPDTLGIIPGSMGVKSFIVRGAAGLPLAESFNSCSHGAGRAMSRTEAKRRFTLADHAAAMVGVEARLDADVIDETPGAYKDIDAVMAAQADHVEIVHTLKQVVCVKG